LTDGVDNSSRKTPNDIIALATQNNVRIFTIGLGTAYAGLEMIAQMTNGQYFSTPNAGQLPAIYEECSTLIQKCLDECTLRYRSGCADGGTRTVAMTLNNVCGSSAQAMSAFTAPLDSSDRKPMALYFTPTHTMARRTFSVQLNLPQAMQQEKFVPSLIRVHYDDASLILRKVDIPAVSLLRGVSWTHQEIPGLIQVQTFEKIEITGSGVMLEFTFEARDRQDTVCSEIGLTSWTMAGGCLVPEVYPAEICVYPWRSEPLVFCDISPALDLEWRTSRRSYVPDPVTVLARFDNNGSIAARSGVFIVDYDRTALQRLQPGHDTVIYAIPDILAGSHTAVAWDFKALPRSSPVTTQVCITAQFDNHDDVYCCTEVRIPAAGPVLVCDISAPPIIANPNRGEYDPMPFPVSVRVHNAGETDTDTVRVRIEVPPDLALMPGEAAEKTASPAVLGPQQSATLVWMLTHAPSDVTRHYLVEALSHCLNADTSRCETAVNIPVVSALDFRVELQRSGPVEFCEGASLTLDAGAGFDAWLWSTGDTTRRITVRQSGDYSCVLRLGNRTGYSDTVSVLMHPRPRPVVDVTGSIPLCPGDTVYLDAGAGYASYAWSNSLAVRRFSVTLAGSYYVDVTDASGCSGRSDTVVVTMHPAASTPVITRTGDVLSAGPAASWQWYRNGTPIPGAQSQDVVLAETGTYTVRITDARGCTAVSDPYAVNILSVRHPAAAAASLRIYPNPGTGIFTVLVGRQNSAPMTVTVADILGRVVFQHRLEADDAVSENGIARFELDLRAHPPGMYIVTTASVAGQYCTARFLRTP